MVLGFERILLSESLLEDEDPALTRFHTGRAIVSVKL
jgi:hypothetical protein